MVSEVQVPLATPGDIIITVTTAIVVKKLRWQVELVLQKLGRWSLTLVDKASQATLHLQNWPHQMTFVTVLILPEVYFIFRQTSLVSDQSSILDSFRVLSVLVLLP